ncbi:hypothetical protein GA0070616_3853 [Micromonospora nigra]|uniref:Flavin reductase n=1 Tax=Micromonospora nigra TaxID=145857 RepID=A0A1C6SIN5_9ACTN|nr:hypothetical protein [Micromonospora nigra]SCL29268.1 hypothetical protein GA0070616_3853 [Micromonospora nigra]
MTRRDGPHVPLRPLWLCRVCARPWPCGRAKLDLLAEYDGNRIGLFLHLAGCLHAAIDELHRCDPVVTGSAATMYDRFLGWPSRSGRVGRVGKDAGSVG